MRRVRPGHGLVWLAACALASSACGNDSAPGAQGGTGAIAANAGAGAAGGATESGGSSGESAGASSGNASGSGGDSNNVGGSGESGAGADAAPPAPERDVISFDGAAQGQPCALRRNGQLWCIETPFDETPVFTQIAVAPGAVAVVRGSAVRCLLDVSGGVSCWGSGGLVGDGTTEARTEPTPVLGITSATHIDTWVGHSCAVHSGGSVSCWGQNDALQIQAGGEANYPEPHAISGITDAAQVATSRLGTCVLSTSGGVACWGDDFGAAPTPIDGISDGVDISAGHFHFCVRSAAGNVACFGGERAGLEAEVPSPIADAAEAIAFHSETCYRSVQGSVSCWGTPASPGQTLVPPLEPIAGLNDAVALANHCALRASGAVSCWRGRDELIEVTAGFE